MFKFILSATLVGIVLTNTEKLFEPCKATDSVCLIKQGNKVLKSVLNSYKSYGVPSLNPFVTAKAESKTPDLYFELEPVNIYGFENATVKKIEIDLHKKTIYVETTSDYIKMQGPYKLQGKFDNKNLDGEGEGAIHGSQLFFKYTAHYGLEVKNGRTYAKISQSTASYDVKRVEINFENIVKGDELASKEVNKKLNENVFVLLKVIGGDLVEVIAKVHDTVLGGIMNKLPFDEIVLS